MHSLSNLLAVSLSLLVLSTPAAARNCGFRIADCEYPEVCMATDPYCTIYGTCAGTCKPDPYVYCGGFANNQKCPRGQECLNDPRYSDEFPDLPGFCAVKKNLQRCGDVPRACPTSQRCYSERDCESGCQGGICMHPPPLVP